MTNFIVSVLWDIFYIFGNIVTVITCKNEVFSYCFSCYHQRFYLQGNIIIAYIIVKVIIYLI